MPHSTLNLPTRTQKPRKSGITAINDVGIPCEELKNILNDYHSFLDIAKFGIGTALITPRLQDKITLYHKYDILVHFGGTLFEKFYSQNKIGEYLDFLESHRIHSIEVSSGTIDIPVEERLDFIKSVSNRFNVIAEVGSKEPDKVMPPSVWINEIGLLLDAGCSYVILEGRDSATAGMYRPSGEMRTGLLADILSAFRSEQLIIEAPTAETQIGLIQLLGANVNLANISPRGLLQLETQRRGLRSDTFLIS